MRAVGVLRIRSPRRDRSRRQLALQGLVAVMATALALALLFANAQGKFSQEPQVQAVLDNVGGSLGLGSDVKYHGAIVGKVTGIDPRVGGARVELTMQGSEIGSLPSNVVARVLPATVFGTSYIDLTVHGRNSGSALSTGAIVAQDRTQETVELQKGLDSIDGLVKALGPAKLQVALTSISQALDGRGAKLGHSIDLANSLLGRYLRRFPVLADDIDLLATNLETAQAIAPQLMTTIADGLVTARTLSEQQGSLADLLSAGLGLTGLSNQFLQRHGDALVRGIRQADGVIDATYDNRELGIIGSFGANYNLATRIPQVIGPNGIVLKAGITVLGPGYYTAADCPTVGSRRGRC